MRKPIYKLKVSRNQPGKVASAILAKLKEKNLYAPTLMYRGLVTDEEGLGKIRKYGTDRNPEDMFDFEDELGEIPFAEDPETGAVDIDYEHYGETEEDFHAHAIERMKGSRRPNEIWAKTEKGLRSVIKRYCSVTGDDMFNVIDIPVILAYRRENLIPADVAKGLVRPIPPEEYEEREKQGDDYCEYQFKETTTPLEGLVAGFRF